jgi:hypothetical protein
MHTRHRKWRCDDIIHIMVREFNIIVRDGEHTIESDIAISLQFQGDSFNEETHTVCSLMMNTVHLSKPGPMHYVRAQSTDICSTLIRSRQVQQYCWPCEEISGIIAVAASRNP